MINTKYYHDIAAFPEQFGHEFAVQLPDLSSVQRVILCGMGGSSLYVPLVNNILAQHSTLFVEACRDYTLPAHTPEQTLIICASHSGNTEEILSCFDLVADHPLVVVFASGGQLLQRAQDRGVPIFQIPRGLQPRLSTGYFVKALLSVIHHIGACSANVLERVQAACHHLADGVDDSSARELATQLVGKLPIIYTSANISSIATISKIKLNENSKIQSRANSFPELNHNEMVGWTQSVTDPVIIILVSSLDHPRNLERVRIFEQVISEYNIPVHTIQLPGETLEDHLFGAYMLMDYVSYHLADQYGIDPEPVAMVEDFKALLAG